MLLTKEGCREDESEEVGETTCGEPKRSQGGRRRRTGIRPLTRSIARSLVATRFGDGVHLLQLVFQTVPPKTVLHEAVVFLICNSRTRDEDCPSSTITRTLLLKLHPFESARGLPDVLAGGVMEDHGRALRLNGAVQECLFWSSTWRCNVCNHCVGIPMEQQDSVRCFNGFQHIDAVHVYSLLMC